MTHDGAGRPAFTIVTPSFNQAPFIGRTIASVLSQEGAGEVEYLVFDGGSTDGTVEILRAAGPRVVWRSERDRGQAHAVNKGLAAARGEIIGWLNSDDVYFPGALAAAARFFAERPDVLIAYGHADHIDANDRYIEDYYTRDWDYEAFQDVCFICQPAVFFRRSVPARFGPLDESLSYCMDYEYWLRIGAQVPLHRIPGKLAGSRLHDATKTLGQRVRVHEEICRMTRARLGRTPFRWISNLAHVIAQDEGYVRADPESQRRYARRVARATVRGAFRFNRGLPLRDLARAALWWVKPSRLP